LGSSTSRGCTGQAAGGTAVTRSGTSTSTSSPAGRRHPGSAFSPPFRPDGPQTHGRCSRCPSRPRDEPRKGGAWGRGSPTRWSTSTSTTPWSSPGARPAGGQGRRGGGNYGASGEFIFFVLSCPLCVMSHFFKYYFKFFLTVMKLNLFPPRRRRKFTLIVICVVLFLSFAFCTHFPPIHCPYTPIIRENLYPSANPFPGSGHRHQLPQPPVTDPHLPHDSAIRSSTVGRGPLPQAERAPRPSRRLVDRGSVDSV